MLRIKYLICILLISAGFLFNGELFIFHLDYFQDSYYRTSFSFSVMSDGVPDEKIVSDFIDAGENHDVDFFMVDTKFKSSYEKEITIYGTDKALKHLKKKGIDEKEYKSLFVGNSIVRYEDFNKMKYFSKYDYCYLLGDETKEKDMDSFKAELMASYGGSFPKLYGSDKGTYLNIFSVWLIIFLMLLIISIYEVIYQKKETAIKIILGGDIRSIFIKNSVKDTWVYSLIFIMLPILFLGLSNVLFKISFTILLFLLFLLINIGVHATILFINFKKNLSTSSGGKGVLATSYALKIVTSVLVIILLSSNFVIIAQGIDSYRQGDFFEKHKNYSYYRLNYRLYQEHSEKIFEDETNMNRDFYNRFQDRALQYSDMTENFGGETAYPILLVNQNTIKEESQKWPKLDNILKNTEEAKFYMLIPSHIQIDSDEVQHAEMIYSNFFGREYGNNIKKLFYEEDISLVALQNQGRNKSKMADRPIILFNNTIEKIDEVHEEGADCYAFDMWYAYDILYDIPDMEFQQFVEEYALGDQIVVKANALEIHKSKWAAFSRSMKIVLVLSAFLIILEMMLITFIIKLEYKTNSVELALKKIYGYTLFKRNKRIIKLTISCSILSILVSYFTCLLLELPGGINIIWGGLLLLTLEVIYILKKAKSIEKAKLPAILKGERL